MLPTAIRTSKMTHVIISALSRPGFQYSYNLHILLAHLNWFSKIFDLLIKTLYNDCFVKFFQLPKVITRVNIQLILSQNYLIHAVTFAFFYFIANFSGFSYNLNVFIYGYLNEFLII